MDRNKCGIIMEDLCVLLAILFNSVKRGHKSGGTCAGIIRCLVLAHLGKEQLNTDWQTFLCAWPMNALC